VDKGDMTTATKFDPVRARYDDKHPFSLWLDGSTSRKLTTKAKLAGLNKRPLSMLAPSVLAGLMQYGEHAPTERRVITMAVTVALASLGSKGRVHT
jgi:hypothetical protein